MLISYTEYLEEEGIKKREEKEEGGRDILIQ